MASGDDKSIEIEEIVASPCFWIALRNMFKKQRKNTSAKTSRKGKGRTKKVGSLRREREHGWQQEELCSSFKFILPDVSSAREFRRKLEESEGFHVDGETRSFDVAGFYRVYPYYDWDAKQIQDQKAILNHCCTVAVKYHNQRTGDDLVYDKLVSANMLRDGFPIYFITLKAYHDGDKRQQIREYRTKVQYIRYHGVTNIAQAIINIHCFRPVKV